jgi:hypothetical protein
MATSEEPECDNGNKVMVVSSGTVVTVFSSDTGNNIMSPRMQRESYVMAS